MMVSKSDDRGKAAQQMSSGWSKDFLNLLSREETLKVIELYRKLNSQDYGCQFFNGILPYETNILEPVILEKNTMSEFETLKNDYCLCAEYCERDPCNRDLVKTKIKMERLLLKMYFKQLMMQKHVLEDLKNGNWNNLLNWLGDYNTLNLTKETILVATEDTNEVTMTDFEMLLCLIFTELYKGMQAFLRSDEMWQSIGYQSAMTKVQHILKLLYHNFMLYLNDDNEARADIKLYLHVCYEIDASVHYLKDLFAHFGTEIQTAMQSGSDAVHPHKRTIQKIYYNL